MTSEANSDMTLSSEASRRLEQLFARLIQSKFRSRFRLGKKERLYLKQKGLAAIEAHARKFIKERLAPAFPPNDGKQTPMKNHPVFIAQHATATCCRKCLEKWHSIAKGKELTEPQIDYIVSVIMHWLQKSATCGHDNLQVPSEKQYASNKS